MGKKTYQAWMEEAGWTTEKMSGGPAFRLELGDRVLRSVPAFSKTPDKFIVIDYASVWMPRFAKARHEIFPTIPLKNCQLVRRTGTEFSTEGPGSAEFIRELTDELRAWAINVDESTEIARHAKEREVYGLDSMDHVAALALLGETEALKDWRSEVETAERPRLHPLVKLENLDRAIAVSERNSVSYPLA